MLSRRGCSTCWDQPSSSSTCTSTQWGTCGCISSLSGWSRDPRPPSSWPASLSRDTQECVGPVLCVFFYFVVVTVCTYIRTYKALLFEHVSYFLSRVQLRGVVVWMHVCSCIYKRWNCTSVLHLNWSVGFFVSLYNLPLDSWGSFPHNRESQVELREHIDNLATGTLLYSYT